MYKQLLVHLYTGILRSVAIEDVNSKSAEELLDLRSETEKLHTFVSHVIDSVSGQVDKQLIQSSELVMDELKKKTSDFLTQKNDLIFQSINARLENVLDLKEEINSGMEQLGLGIEIPNLTLTKYDDLEEQARLDEMRGDTFGLFWKGRVTQPLYGDVSSGIPYIAAEPEFEPLMDLYPESLPAPGWFEDGSSNSSLKRVVPVGMRYVDFVNSFFDTDLRSMEDLYYMDAIPKIIYFGILGPFHGIEVNVPAADLQKKKERLSRFIVENHDGELKNYNEIPRGYKANRGIGFRAPYNFGTDRRAGDRRNDSGLLSPMTNLMNAGKDSAGALLRNIAGKLN